MSYTRFNKRAVMQALTAQTRLIVSDLATIASANITRDAPRDSHFLAETVEAIVVDGTGQTGKTEQRRSAKTGQTVERTSHAAAPLPPDTAAVHVGADYAIDAEIREPFIWPNIEALAASLPGVVAKRRV